MEWGFDLASHIAGCCFVFMFVLQSPLFYWAFLRDEKSPTFSNPRLRHLTCLATTVQFLLIAAVIGIERKLAGQIIPKNALGFLWASLPASMIVIHVFLTELTVLAILRRSLDIPERKEDSIDSQRLAILLICLALAEGVSQVRAVANSGPLNCADIGEMWLLIVIWTFAAWQLMRVAYAASRMDGSGQTLKRLLPRKIYGCFVILWACAFVLVPTC